MHFDAEPDQLIHYIHDGNTLPTQMSRMLEDAGFRMKPHTSATALLDAQHTHLRGGFLLDVHSSHGLDGLEIQAELQRRNDHLPVIFLSAHGSIAESVKAVKRGAFDFLTKQTSHEVVLETLAKALARESKAWELKQRLRTLTHAERQVFAIVTAGLTNRQISRKLGCTERTVRAHRASVMEKMAARSVAELVHQAHELGLTPEPA